MNREEALRLDAVDPLASFRDRFVISDPDLIYMDGNSLGRLPSATVERLSKVVLEEWGAGLVRSWDAWIDLPATVGDKIATLVGANPGEVILSDSTSVNLFKLAMAACAARPGRTAIVATATDFPSDRYVLEGVAAAQGMELRMLDDLGNLPAAIDRDVAVVSLSHVDYRTAALHDMAGITAMAHARGALMLWDLCHSVGAVPIDLAGCEVDLAVGCTYKFLNSGPGAPSFLYVRADLQESLSQPIWGWFGQADQFAMGPRYDPAPGIGRYAVGTPPMLAVSAVDEGVSLTLQAGIDRLRAKSVAQTAMMIDLADEMLDEHGVTVATPRDAEMRGSHVALRHHDAFRISQAMINRGVIPDFREPDIVRFGVAPLYTRFVDIYETIFRLTTTLGAREHEAIPRTKTRVT